MGKGLFPAPANAPRGLDVSHYQGTIDWSRVAQEGMAFAFIKATEGTSEVDPQFHTNWSNAKTAGLMHGAYHFYQPSADPRRQAWNFLNVVQFGPADLPPVLDVETLGEHSSLVSGIREWLAVVEEATGRTPILYTNPSFWKQLGAADFGRFPLWIAEYGVTTPMVPEGWSSWAFWQFSESQRVAGIQTPVDFDLFHGTLQDLQQMAQA